MSPTNSEIEVESRVDYFETSKLGSKLKSMDAALAGILACRLQDVGKMIAIGTHIEYNNITTVGYSANKDVRKCVLIFRQTCL